MKTTILIAISVLISMAMPLSGKENREDRCRELERKINLENDMAKASIGDALEYAFLLYCSDSTEDMRKADEVLETAISYQVSDDPESGNYGLWPWSVGSRTGDKNVPLFHSHVMFVSLWSCQDKMSDNTRKEFRNACERILVAAERRYDEELFEPGRDGIPYSNIFALYVRTLTLAADRYDSDRLRRKAETQWRRFYNHVSFYGVSEFLSTTYYQIIFEALKDIAEFGTGRDTAAQARELMDFIYLQQSAVTHPLLKMQITGIGRDYREFTFTPDARVEFLRKPVPGYEPDSLAAGINTNREYPFEAYGRAGAFPFIYHTYQTEHAGMGSMSGDGNYYEQQIYCMAAAGNDEFEKAVMFIPGSNVPVNGFTCQDKMSAICVFNMLPTMWHLTQWKGEIEDYRSTYDPFGIGFTDRFDIVDDRDGHIILRAYGYDIHLFPFRIEDGKAVRAELETAYRKSTSSSGRYHPRSNRFRELLFAQDADWFGTVIMMVGTGTKVETPEIEYRQQDGIHTFSAGDALSVSIARTEEGNCVQVRDDCVQLIPRLEIK